MKVFIHKHICLQIKQIPPGPWSHELQLYGIKINDLENNRFKFDKEIKSFIGADIVGEILTRKIRRLKCGITAIATIVAWTFNEKLNSNPGMETNSVNSASFTIFTFHWKDRYMSDPWMLDVLGITEPPLS